ncbi:MAG: BNR repeat-containing protein [Cyclobacteriaceae bacterium]|nr:BNR repeat-containing protein [Cyclobacteriaceae bacterium]
MNTPKRVFFVIGCLAFMAPFLLINCKNKPESGEASANIIEQIDVAPVWSVHRTGPPELLTRDGLQYVAYYDQDRYLTLAQRELGSSQWKYQRFPVQMGWQTGAHAKLSLALDRQGYIHITCYRRGLLQEPPMPPRPIYYRSVAPHSIDEFERLHMVSETERTDYPTFATVEGTIFFSFRDGSSGQGDQHFYRYDDQQRRWERVLDKPLLDGRGEMSAYVYGSGVPQFGPDGRWHLLWMWRNTPDHASNHSLSYARTTGSDLTQWESASGVPVIPPFSIDNSELIVDAVPPGGGMSNPLQAMYWDSKKRVVISYHRFDENGFSQIYNARFEGEAWRIVPSTNWDFVWGDSYSGTGALDVSGTVRLSAVSAAGKGELRQMVWNREVEEKIVILDEATMEPIRSESPQTIEWQEMLTIPESDFQVEAIPDLRRNGGPMQVELLPAKDGSDSDGDSYFLRWEHGGINRDRPVPEPWPAPTMLRLYKISTEK